MLLKEQESCDCVRAQAYKAGDPASKGPSDTFFSIYTCEQGEYALLSMCTHDPGLDNIHRTAHGCGHKPGQETGAEVGGQAIFHVRLFQQYPFDGVVAGQLACRHQDGSHAVGADASEETPPSFFSDHPYHALYCILIISSLRLGEGAIVLHSDVEYIGWVSGYSAQKAGGASHGDQGRKGWLVAGGGEGLLELRVDAEAGGGVGELP